MSVAIYCFTRSGHRTGRRGGRGPHPSDMVPTRPGRAKSGREGKTRANLTVVLRLETVWFESCWTAFTVSPGGRSSASSTLPNDKLLDDSSHLRRRNHQPPSGGSAETPCRDGAMRTRGREASPTRARYAPRSTLCPPPCPGRHRRRHHHRRRCRDSATAASHELATALAASCRRDLQQLQPPPRLLT